MLYRQIYVFYYSVIRFYFLYQLIRYLIGIAIKKSYPRNICFLCYRAQKLCKLVFAVNIKTVARCILRDKVKFLYADSLKLLCLFYDILDRSRSHPASYGGYRAISATVITAFGDLQIRRVFRSCDYSLSAERKRFLIAIAFIMFTAQNSFNSVAYLCFGAESKHCVNFGQLCRYLLAISFGKTTCNNYSL